MVWAKNLSCIWINPNNTLQLRGGRYRSSGIQDYVAVSYSWKETPGLEDAKAGGYSIFDCKDGHVRPSKVRDQALSRVIRYAKYHQVFRFWIDRECIPDDKSEERQIAMESMDLVYRTSAYPVGLLAATLETQDQVNQLQDLLLGAYAVLDEDSYPRLVQPVHASSSRAAFNLLRRLQADRWWNRAWIFQEEYLSSIRMHLLIRRKQDTVAFRQFGFLHGEMCINAANFREQATIFLLAFQREAQGKRSRVSAQMLKMLGSYKIQYRFQHDAKGKAMAPRIFADIQRRGIEKLHDRIHIAANSCNYAIRFNSEIMLDRGHDLDLCLLTMYLLNGELLRGVRNIQKLPTDMHLTNYLQYITFDKFDVPVEGKDLSYLKTCRLYGVSLSYEGILAKGHVWRFSGALFTRAWPPAPRWSRKYHNKGLNNFQRDCLHQALIKLRNYDQALHFLAGRIEHYLEQDMLDADPSPVKQHMDLMAESVVEAIRVGKPLQVVSMHEDALPCSLFTGLMKPATGVFASWYAGFGGDGRHRQSQVSLGVEVEDTIAGPRLTTVQWVNGLVFFKQNEQTTVIFRWPQKWLWKF
ncbi:hypothetical protein CKM354_001125000 [Cercospora kikuchii]|uniref:Heterokaryon incompatibility domain-containing protein n=1 Tax=Cercospora kikuchii TaxID=84275 RepID=A0A9P3CRX8_9PEZI|nr:uncharacterized protein CKM354_001125000 [Cercospora kikuchii]GIZ48177.1 hypothetical protein CKM354_001125000 [Cercospora kikuchii]